MSVKKSILVMGLSVATALASAMNIPYIASGGYWENLGNDGTQGGNFDRLWLGDNSVPSTMGNPVAGTFLGVTSTPSVVYLEDWFFEIGLNSSSAHTDPVSFDQDLTVNGITKTFTLAGTIDINFEDTLTVGDSNVLLFDLGGGTSLQFKALGFTTGPVGNNGSTASGTIRAEVSLVSAPVPEPFTMVLGAAGLAVAAIRKRRA